MFFQAINRMITAGTDLSFSIRQVDNRLTVAVMPRRTGLKGEAGGQIVPLVLNGTPEELDAEFLQAISTPVQKAQGILTNLETFEKQAEQAASQNKGAKSPLEKEPKEVREKREKMEKLLKKADEAIAGKRYSEALTWLRQAKVLATPDRQKDIDAKMAEVQKKNLRGKPFRRGTVYAGVTTATGSTTTTPARRTGADFRAGTGSCHAPKRTATAASATGTIYTACPFGPIWSGRKTGLLSSLCGTTGSDTSRTARAGIADHAAGHTVPSARTHAAAARVRRTMAATGPGATAECLRTGRTGKQREPRVQVATAAGGNVQL